MFSHAEGGLIPAQHLGRTLHGFSLDSSFVHIGKLYIKRRVTIPRFMLASDMKELLVSRTGCPNVFHISFTILALLHA